MVFLKLKITDSEIKNLLNELSIRLDVMKEIISELEERSVETI